MNPVVPPISPFAFLSGIMNPWSPPIPLCRDPGILTPWSPDWGKQDIDALGALGCHAYAKYRLKRAPVPTDGDFLTRDTVVARSTFKYVLGILASFAWSLLHRGGCTGQAPRLDHTGVK